MPRKMKRPKDGWKNRCKDGWKGRQKDGRTERPYFTSGLKVKSAAKYKIGTTLGTTEKNFQHEELPHYHS